MQNDLLRLLRGTFPDGPRKDIWELSDKFLKLETRMQSCIFNPDYQELQVIKICRIAGNLAATTAAFAVWTTKDEQQQEAALKVYRKRYDILKEAAGVLDERAVRARYKREGGLYAE